MWALFLTVALAACPKMFGVQNPDGDWNFSTSQAPGMREVETDERCLAQAGTYVDQGGKLVIDPVLLEQKRLDEAPKKSALEIKIETLEAKIKAIEDSQKAK